MIPSRHVTVVRLPPPDWERYKGTIIDLYITQNMTLQDLSRTMLEKYKFKATDRQYTKRFWEWRVRKHSNGQERDQVVADVAEAILHNEEPDRKWTLEDFQKARRHLWKRMKADDSPCDIDEFNLQALDHFIALRSARDMKSTENLSGIAPGVGDGLGSTSRKRPGSGIEARTDSLPLPAAPKISSSSNASYDGTLSPYHPVNSYPTAIRLGPNIDGYQDATTKASTPIGPKIFEECLFWTRRFYKTVLQRHRALQQSATNTSAAPVPLPLTNVSENFDNTDNPFWHNIESALYFLKMGSEDLARPILHSFRESVPTVCTLQPLTLLRHVFNTLAPMNTNMRPELQKFLLLPFAEVTRAQSQNSTGRWQNNDTISKPLHELFYRLWKLSAKDEGTEDLDNLFRSLLHVLVSDASDASDARNHLLTKDPELFELRWSLVRFDRRAQNLAVANTGCVQLVRDAQDDHGKNHALTRQAMSELAYISKEQAKKASADAGRGHGRSAELSATKYREALGITEEVMRRGKADLQQRRVAFPDTQCIYAMEDVAEALQNVGGQQNLKNSILWLSRAHEYAQKHWGPEESNTKHIKAKLGAASALMVS